MSKLDQESSRVEQWQVMVMLPIQPIVSVKVAQPYLENCMLDTINFSNEYLAHQWQGSPNPNHF